MLPVHKTVEIVREGEGGADAATDNNLWNVVPIVALNFYDYG